MQNYEVMYHKIIAGNVRVMRKKAKFSQEKLAELLGCSREFISRVENNKEKLSLRMVLKLSFIFKMPPENFFKKE
ncbi:MAG: helix-turn-helix transcriptional regulator [bacterium]|nr:helix-turn-helix transcriptional regulator [bacterium]